MSNSEEPGSLSEGEALLNDSRISPAGNGDPSRRPHCSSPPSGQKWWAAVMVGFLFALLSSPPAYALSSTIITGLGGMPLLSPSGATLGGLLVQTLLFILAFRFVLW